MPLYEIKCGKCGYSEEIFRKLSEYNEIPLHCGQMMQRVMGAPKVIPDIQPYKSMMTGEMITSRTKHKAHLKAHGVVEVGNDSMEPKPDLTAEKRKKDALRQEIAARLSTT